MAVNVSNPQADAGNLPAVANPPFAGPDKVIWIKVVPYSGTSDIRVYYKAEKNTNPVTYNFGFFILDNTNQKKNWAKLLIDKIIVPGARLNHTLTDDNTKNVKYEFSDTFTVGGMAGPNEVSDPVDCTHFEGSALS